MLISIIDNLFYQIYINQKGTNKWTVVDGPTIWNYISSFPGLLLTCLSLLPLIIAAILLATDRKA